MKILPLMGAALACLPATTFARQKQPNIILFLVDDMGWQECSVPFWEKASDLNRRYRTPNMERLAQMGTKFTQAYACAISSPSRCSLMTGMNAARHRVTNWTLHYDQSTDLPGENLILPDWHYNGIQPAGKATPHDLKNSTAATCFPQILHDNGYYTIHCGKAHFAAIGTTGADPLSFGFDVNIAGGANGAPASYLAENEFGKGPFHVSGLEKYYGTGTFLSEALTIEALRALRKPIDQRQPFYLYMSHYAIHAPYRHNADKRFTPNYTDPDGRGKYDPFLGQRLDENEINHAALIEGMDKSLGDILDFLEARPEVAQNTIIIFMSDNGGQGNGPRQGTINRDQNYPARAGKGSAYEGGIHEPMMVYWPRVTRPGSINANRVMIEDFFPTILDMAGIKRYHTVQSVDGRSFADLLRKPSRKRDRTAIWHFPNHWDGSTDKSEGYGAYSAIMKGDHHLIYFWGNQELRLYNIRRDIGEQNNLAAAMPDLTRKLARELTDSLKAYRAQRPSIKATMKLAPWPDEAAAHSR